MNIKSAVQSSTRTLFTMLRHPDNAWYSNTHLSIVTPWFTFITDRVRCTTGRLCFDTCLSVCPHLGGVPGQVQPGGTPARSSQAHLGYPRQTWLGGGYLTSGNRWSTWYAAVGMPLAFTQEDFLVSNNKHASNGKRNTGPKQPKWRIVLSTALLSWFFTTQRFFFSFHFIFFLQKWRIYNCSKVSVVHPPLASVRFPSISVVFYFRMKRRFLSVLSR